MGLTSEFAQAIHDKQLVVLAVTGLFAIADIALNLKLSPAQLTAGAGVVATYLGTSTYLAAKHAQGEHQVAEASQSLDGVTKLVEQAAPLLKQAFVKSADPTELTATVPASTPEPVAAEPTASTPALTVESPAPPTSEDGSQ